jgi:hypothetical protein
MPTAPGAGWDMPTIVVVVAMLAVAAIAHVSRWWLIRCQATMTPAQEVFT